MMNTQFMTRNAMIASLYIALTLVPPLNAISFLAIQFRISEALLILVWFRKDYRLGLVLGTFIANLFGPLGGGFAFLDAFLGSIVTFFALQWMISVKHRWVGLFAPIFFNAIYLAIFLPLAIADLPFTLEVIALTGLTVALGQASVLILLALPLWTIIQRQPKLVALLTQEKS